MATVANAFAGISVSALAGLKKAVQAMGTTNFELLAGGTAAAFIDIMNSLQNVRLGFTPGSWDTALDTVLKQPVNALKAHTNILDLQAIYNAVSDADATEFDALNGDTRANVLLWIADAASIIISNSDIANSNAAWVQ